ncbi:MAG: DUF4350 domain-containing protein [Burkholderiales bacterium]|nr:DUF4350 domain-containing protein [Burkholderiales bacterium]
MSWTPRQWITTVLTVIVVGWCAWWWQGHMEYGWHRVDKAMDAQFHEPMRAAAALLQQQGRQVIQENNLTVALAKQRQASMIILANREGEITKEDGAALLEWVSGGGVLVIEAMTSTDKHRASDPVTQATQVVSEYFAKHVPANGAKGYTVVPPGTDHPLKLASKNWYLHRVVSSPALAWSDDDQTQWMVLPYGDGHIMLTPLNRFNNYELYQQDHAELLVDLLDYLPKQGSVCIVRGLASLPWYELLWARVPYGLCALFVFIALMLWSAMVRFGPLLPESSTTRRALMEHIDASARWLWLTSKGREALLRAVRTAVRSRLGRRRPELLRLGPAELAHRLAAERSLPIRLVDEALNQSAATRHFDFVRQIKTLQELRKHHER